MNLTLETKFGRIDAVEVEGDLPEGAFAELSADSVIGIDTETSGLDWASDQLGLVQVFMAASKTVYLMRPTSKSPTRLLTLLASTQWIKVFHFALFDLRFLDAAWGIKPRNIRCTKIASKLLKPARDKHSLAGLIGTYLDVTLPKDSSIRISDWTVDELSKDQLSYAALDAAYLPRLFHKLKRELISTGRHELADPCFSFIPTQLRTEMMGVENLFGY